MDSIEEIEDALNIDIASADYLRVEDCRRLTGPGFLWAHPGAVLQLSFDGISSSKLIDLWHKNARKVLDAIGWTNETFTERGFDGGINLAISAPMDQLYSAVFVAQTIWHFCAAKLLSAPAGDFDAMIDDLMSVKRREANPALISLLQAAQLHGLDVLCDDDELSIGHGVGSQTWLVSDLPSPDSVDWPRLHNIPISLITGTNGKTTTTRLCAAIVRAAGKVEGLTSTDFIQVGQEILDRGDYSGPGGARMLLRDPRLEVACLEVARCGILRRGLPTRQARVAIVTNVAADHLGQYGINTVPELAQAKFAVSRALSNGGILVLNADDDFVVAEAAETKAEIWWFSLNHEAPQISTSKQAGRPCAWLEDGKIVFFDGQKMIKILDVQDIPITMAGAARYNILNATGATCVTRALGVEFADIRAGLTSFRSDTLDNPGRLNEFEVNGARLFVDFAHNPHSIAAVAETIAAMPAKRRFVLLSHAGDRSDDDIRAVTNTALGIGPEFVVAADLPEYLRGRELGDVSAIITDTCLSRGMQNQQLIRAGSPYDGVIKVLDRVQPGDVALLLVLSDRDKIFELLAQNSG